MTNKDTIGNFYKITDSVFWFWIIHYMKHT